jgi:hypothetical protein
MGCRAHGLHRCAAGTGFSLTAVFIVLMTHQLPGRMAHAGASAFRAHRGGDRAGRLRRRFAPTALTAMIVSDALMSWMWGALPDSAATSWPLPGLAASGALISAASRCSPTTHVCSGPCVTLASVSLEELPGREVVIGTRNGTVVTRILPNKERRMVGAWCFADHTARDITGTPDDRRPARACRR